jgi:membrane protease YdiL (CAAX protease family)
MKFAALKAIALGIGLFLVVYVPAFVTTALVRPRIDIAIPLIIAITLLVALILMFVLARRPAGVAEFGFRIPHSRYLAGASVFGLALGLGVSFVSHLFPSRPPFDVSGFAPWKIGLYFLIGASIQEEIVFRGLIQSMVERRWKVSFSLVRGSLSGAVAFSAALFRCHPFRVGGNRSTRRDHTWVRCGRIEATQRQPSAGDNSPRSLQRV